ncbi:flagellar basal body rod modification protein (plasmid) [Paracoccus sp. TK19116]|uniref:Basal-body rod modification protein FlgD n=1 Tax=Paracoccus albicereus TaxID=2922394 RepID=A0ABT1MLQ1_9RHOB|nr:flagellar hook capping FlgD N-terminal domain-containing protein [Paracoccus albicereus]MCQ0969223.1 flagellar basal body rod modification protein [Paracoccus albicereus]
MVTSVNTSPTVAGTTSQAKAASGEAARGAFANGDFETFLRMLTTQLKNQDPLNPMEGSDFAVQLATFSGVEQQAQTNKLLTQMVGQSGGSSLTELSGWIGKEARTTAPVWFGADPLTLDVAPDSRADSVILVTKDAAGREIMREEIGPGAGQVDWLGRDASGVKLPDGVYAFSIESWAKGEKIGESKVGAYGRVIEAETGPEGATLTFEGGGSALADDVTAIREPDAA